jgi:hypothetical protein
MEWQCFWINLQASVKVKHFVSGATVQDIAEAIHSTAMQAVMQ